MKNREPVTPASTSSVMPATGAAGVARYLSLRSEALEVCRRPQSVQRDERLVALLGLIHEQAGALTGGGTPVTSR